MSSDIIKSFSRYVVPFCYAGENAGYERICTYLKNSSLACGSLNLPKDGKWAEYGFWEDYKSGAHTSGEMDIYSYLPAVFKNAANGDSVNNLGTSYVYTTSGKILDLMYENGEVKFPVACKDIGVVVMKNGIGFIWYDMEIRKEIDTAAFVGFQHAVKELARPHSERITIKTFDEEKREPVYEPFCLGLWLTKFFNSRNLLITFWAERTLRESYEKGGAASKKNVCVPDKALLYQYLFITPKDKAKRHDIAFHIANGYDYKYISPDNLSEEIYSPFGNVDFYVSNSGMACVVTDDNSNEAFFTGQYAEIMKGDYFFIYLLLLYQSYTCKNYARLLTGLPADEASYVSEAEYIDRLENLNTNINLFLVKSVFDSVSNIRHQNGVYLYGKDRLSVDGDIASITAGLAALESIEREKKAAVEAEFAAKREKTLNTGLTIFGFLVVFSAAIDAVALADRFTGETKTGVWQYIALGAVALPAIIFIITLFASRKKRK